LRISCKDASTLRLWYILRANVQDLHMERQLEFHWSTPQPETGATTALAEAPPLFPGVPHQEFQAELERVARQPVQLAFTNNRSTVMSVRHTGGVARVRLHQMFLFAPAPVREAVARWVRNPKSTAAGKVLDAFIREHRGQLAPAPPREIEAREHGTVHNLRTLFDDVNATEFGGAVQAKITWGLEPRQRRRRSIRLGSYCPTSGLIRIHPRLDDAKVPYFFIRYVVFHEMLHAHLGILDGPGGRRSIHHGDFQIRERTYKDYPAAVAWLEDPRNLARLLRSRK
jgi:hypothetical protein